MTDPADSSKSSSCLAAYLFISLPPSLAFLYAVSILAFLALWHERSWSSMNKPLLLRLTICTAAVASSVALCQSDSNESLWYPVTLGVFMTIVSTILIYRTRIVEIRGPVPNLKPRCMDGKVVLVTGANSGIGRETVRQLIQAGATVILGCRSESRAREAMDDIASSSESRTKGSATENGALKSSKPARERMYFLPLDLSDLTSVRAAVTKFGEMNLPLHVLINNAGLMMDKKKITKDGYELCFQANHLGHFLLTKLLLSKLRQTAEKGVDVRVVVLTSSTYVLASDGMDLEDLHCERRKFHLFGQYAQTKLANILFGKELARREMARAESKGGKDESPSKPVTSYVVHPGIVRTNVVQNMPWFLYYPNIVFGFVVAAFQKTPESGAYTSVWCAASEEVRRYKSGSYFVNSRMEETNGCANDELAATKLWEISEKLVTQK